MNKTRIAFLDRDGVLNEDSGYVYLPEHFHWTMDAKRAVAWLKEQGFKVAVVTNQSGIGRGMYTEEAFMALTGWMQEELNGALDAIYYCPHHPSEANPPYRVDCDCRKPKPGMLLQGLREFDAEPQDCFFLGDKPTDMEAAKAAGVHGVFFEGGSLLEAVRRASLTVL